MQAAGSSLSAQGEISILRHFVYRAGCRRSVYRSSAKPRPSTSPAVRPSRPGLAQGLAAAFADGDLGAARIAHEALGRLITPTIPGDVIQIAVERTKRGG
jgi:hypothetical protein